jgi:hypothetical protein
MIGHRMIIINVIKFCTNSVITTHALLKQIRPTIKFASKYRIMKMLNSRFCENSP